MSLAKYIELLSEEVDRKNNPAPVSMPPLDTAAALLESIRITVTLESPDYPRWLAEYAYVQSLRAR